MNPPKFALALFFALLVFGLSAAPSSANPIFVHLAVRQDSSNNNNSSDQQHVTALLLPSYGNFTHLRLQGQLFSTPVSGGEEALSSVVSAIGSLFSGGLNDSAKEILKNRTRGFLVVGAIGQNATMTVTALDSVANTSVPVQPFRQENLTAGPTDINGFFDTFVPIGPSAPFIQQTNSSGAGAVEAVQLDYVPAGTGAVDQSAAGSSANRATQRAYIHVSPQQLPADNASQPISVVADIDDVLRVTQIWKPLEGLQRTFVQNPYEVLPGMPEVFATWNSTLNSSNSGPVMFHYLTTTPFPLAGAYEDFLDAFYPPGSLDMRPLNILNPSEVLSARSEGLAKIFETFGSLRKFILLGDTSSPTALSGYADIAKQYSSSIACIYVRNTTKTDPSFDTLHGKPSDEKLKNIFQGVDSSKVVFFGNASELVAPGVNVKNGNCGGGIGGLTTLGGSGAGSRKVLWKF